MKFNLEILNSKTSYKLIELRQISFKNLIRNNYVSLFINVSLSNINTHEI